MHQPFDSAPRINLAVIALGETERLERCLDSLIGHEADVPFSITCVVNPVSTDDDSARESIPGGVHVLRPEANLGWAGGLHAARAATTAEFLVWVQEDMVVLDGWLDALFAAAQAHPEVGAFGSVGVDEDDSPTARSAGWAVPPDDVRLWGATDTTTISLPSTVTAFDWVTSKGLLTRTAAWDDVGGPDPRLFPLHHVDKDYSTHLRCHGWDVALVPDARLRHIGGASSPGPFRRHLAEWLEPRFNRRWSGPAGELAGRSSGTVPHECRPPVPPLSSDVERIAGREASRMLVPIARAISRDLAQMTQTREHDKETALRLAADRRSLIDREEHRKQEIEEDARRHAEQIEGLQSEFHAALDAERATHQCAIAELSEQLDRITTSRSWRWTTPLRRLARKIDRK